VRRLIAERIDSVPELEAILLLRGDGARTWRIDEVGQRLYVSTAVAGHILSTIAARGFCARDNEQYRYAPETVELADVVDQLSAAYASDLIGITNMLHAKPGPSIREFADAFRMRRGK